MLDRSVALANVYFDRAESFKSDIRSRLESDSYISMVDDEWDRGERPGWWTNELEELFISNNLSGADVTSKSMSAELAVIHMDNIRFQFEQGLYPEGAWNGAREIGFERLLSEPIGRAVFLDNPRGLRPYLDDFISENGLSNL